MPARDHLHDLVRKVLTSDGWTITHDPLHLTWGTRDVYPDLGAERFVGAQKGPIRVAVEIKSFIGPSPVHALEKAVGQFALYRAILARVEPDRELYLAVSDLVYSEIFEEDVGELLIATSGSNCW